MAEIKNDRYGRSRFMTWGVIIICNLQMLALLVSGDDKTGEVYLVAIPTMLGLVAAWSGIANWSETILGGKT